MTQPGWFSILMPRPPDVGELTTTSPEGGTLVMKRLSAGMDKGYVSIAYAELQNFDDHDAMLAEVRKGLQAAGARPINVNDVVVEGRDGVEEYLDLPPGSEVNHSSVPMRAQVRVLLDQNRAYVLLGVEPAAIGDSALPQFFSSFSFAPAPIPPGTPSAQQPATPAH